MKLKKNQVRGGDSAAYKPATAAEAVLARLCGTVLQKVKGFLDRSRSGKTWTLKEEQALYLEVSGLQRYLRTRVVKSAERKPPKRRKHK